MHRGLPDITADHPRARRTRVGVDARAANALRRRIETQLGGRSRAGREPAAAEDAARVRPRAGTLRNIDASGGVGFLHDMLEAAGGADVLADIKQQSVSIEHRVVLARAPDVIIELRYARGDIAGAVGPDARGTRSPRSRP